MVDWHSLVVDLYIAETARELGISPSTLVDKLLKSVPWAQKRFLASKLEVTGIFCAGGLA